MASKPVVVGVTTAAAVTTAALTVDGFTLQTGLVEAGPWALLVAFAAFVIMSIFRGWIIVKLHYDTLLERAIAAETANIKLAETNAVLVNTNDVQARTIEKQTAVGDTVEKVMGAIQDARASAGGTS
jgi:hypothetical protein